MTLNLGLRVSLFGTYRERYRNAFNFEPSAFNTADIPTLDTSGGATDGSLTPGSGNPLNGIVQCGGSGGGVTPLPGYPSTIGPSSEAGCLKGHLFNPAPRLGFAWDPKGDGKMAIRGGYGVFFEHTNGNEGNTESLEGSPPLVLTASQFNVQGYSNIGGGVLFPLSVNSVPNKAIWPYVQQWHLDVQKELPGNVIATVSYVGSKGTHLTLLTNTNQLLPVPVADNPFAPGQTITSDDCDALGTGELANGTPYGAQAGTNLGIACGANPDPSRTAFPGFGNINRLEDMANSSYHALQATVRRTVGNLTFSVAYTYSHSIDDSSDRFDSAFVNAYDIASNRASSNFDQRQNLGISYVYGLPFFRKPGLANKLLGGWQISGITIAQTGNPFSVTNATDFGDSAGVGNGVGTGSSPDLVGDPADSHRTRFGTFGPLHYNLLRSPPQPALLSATSVATRLYLPGR